MKIIYLVLVVVVVFFVTCFLDKTMAFCQQSDTETITHTLKSNSFRPTPEEFMAALNACTEPSGKPFTSWLGDVLKVIISLVGYHYIFHRRRS